MKNVLIVIRKKECLVTLNRTSDGSAKLIPHIARIETHKCRRRSPQRTVAQIVERAPVPLVRTRFGYHIHHRPPSATRLRPITARRHAKLLHHLVRKLVRRAIPPRRLRKEPVIVVPAIHQETRVVSSNPAIRKIPLRSRPQPPPTRP